MKVGFIGLGTMGAPMARNVQKKGHALVVFDVNRSSVDALVASRTPLGLKLFGAATEDLMHALRRVSREKVRHAVEGKIDLIGPETGAQRGF